MNKSTILIGLVLGMMFISGCAQKEHYLAVEPPIGPEPPMFVCGSAEARVVVIEPFNAPEFGHPHIIVKLTNIYKYIPGETQKQLISDGDEIEVRIEDGEIDYSKCPQSECPEKTGPGGIKLPCEVQLCNLTDEQKFGSWNSYKLKEGDVIKLSIQGKAAGEGSCDPDRFPKRLYWVAEDSRIIMSEN